MMSVGFSVSSVILIDGTMVIMIKWPKVYPALVFDWPLSPWEAKIDIPQKHA
jgi:hypothetical protein